MNLSAKAGQLAKGFWADIIAIEGDPLADIRMMEKVTFVMKDGKVYRNDLGRKSEFPEFPVPGRISRNFQCQ